MKRLTIFILLFSVFSGAPVVCAQNVNLKGKVILAEDNVPVVGVVVSVQEENGNKILAYGMTDEDGGFSILLPEYRKNLLLTASSMMTETISVPVTLSDENIIVRVKEKKLQLRESKIQASKVTMRGDTLNYNVSSYVKTNDRNIGEILRRIPGITVTSDGKIFYQNLAINKFYVEGLDLLQGRYGLASNNLDPSMVSTIQVLENHQPIRVLEGTETPSQAAINLKLKKSAIGALFLTAQAGLGISPLLYSNELLGMRFTQSQQNLLMYKNDNTGRDFASEMTSFYGTSRSPLQSFFSPEVLTPPSIDKQYYLFNNAHLFSLNDLRLLKKNLTLTGNLHFLMDKQNKTGSYQQSIIDPIGGDIQVMEELSSARLKRELAGTVTLEKNDRDRYLTNRTDANVAWNSQDCTISASNPIAQMAKLPSLCIENQFSYKTAANRWSSRVLYSCQDNALTVSPVLMGDLQRLADSVTQQVRYEQFEADLNYYRNVHLSRNLSFRFNVRPFVKRKNLTSGFIPGENEIKILTDSLSNDFVRSESGIDFGPGLQYKKSSLTAFINLAGQYLFIARNNRITDGQYVQNYLLLLPTGYAEFQKRNFTYRLNASYRQSVPDIKNDLTGYIMSSYRSFSRTTGVAPQSGRFSTDLGVHYKNIGSSFFSSVMAGYDLVHRNYLTSLVYNGIVCQSTGVEYENLSDNLWLNVESGMDIRTLSSTVKLNARLSRSKSESLFQGRVVDYTMDVIQITPSWFTFIGSVASVSYDANYRLGRSVISGRQNHPLHDLKQSLELSVSPFAKSSVKIACNHYYNSGTPSDSSHWFANVGFSYKYRKTEWMLDWSNIFNTREIINCYYDDMSSYCSRYSLRPMEVILRVKFNIL